MQQPDFISQVIDSSAEGLPFDRFFQRCIGSCHAYLTLREDFRQQVRAIQPATGFRYIRCHGIFHDWVGICHELDGELHYNFQNVNKIYDFFLENGLRPYVELSFMPQALASDLSKTIFRYEANISPPADMARWNELVRAFVTHLIDRYGIDEVRHWYFEVWNEPDLKDIFWSGDRQQYLELYRHTATTIKDIDSRLPVGGPSTSKNLWIQETLEFCRDNDLPLDFVSTHHYCADAALEVGSDVYDIRYRGQQAMVDDVKHTVAMVRASAYPDAEVHYTEWNVSPCHEDRFGKDSEFNPAFVLQTLAGLDGVVDVYSYWCISDIFEESGPGLFPFSGKYGLMNINGVKKPVYHAFAWMNQLYDEEIHTGHPGLRVTRSGDDFRILLWQFEDPQETDFNGGDYSFQGAPVRRRLALEAVTGNYQVSGHRIGRDAGNAYRAWQDMGSPQYPTQAQITQLHQAAEPVCCHDELITADNGAIMLEQTLEHSSVVFYELKKIS